MPSSDRGILEAAILAARGLDQAGIAQRLGVNQTTISRRLKRARAMGYLVYPPPQLQLDRIDPNVLESAEYRVNAGHLRDRLLPMLNKLAGTRMVFELSISYTPEHKRWNERLRAPCQAAALRLPEILQTAERVGVSWGNTLRFLIDDLQHLKPLNIEVPPIVFPVVGTFPHTDQADPYPIALTSTSLASDLAAVIRGRVPDDQVSLAAIPAYVPVDFEEIRDSLATFYSQLPGYREVFGGSGLRPRRKGSQGGLVKTADMLITGMGDMPSRENEGSSPSLRERLRHESATPQDWSQIAVGDISGVLLPKFGIEKSQERRVQDINKRFIAIGMEDIQAIARLCTESEGTKPGVFTIAHNRSKAKAVIEAVRRRCINRLFIDQELATELIDSL